MNETKKTVEWHLNEADKCMKQSMSFGLQQMKDKETPLVQATKINGLDYYAIARGDAIQFIRKGIGSIGDDPLTIYEELIGLLCEHVLELEKRDKL